MDTAAIRVWSNRRGSSPDESNVKASRTLRATLTGLFLVVAASLVLLASANLPPDAQQRSGDLKPQLGSSLSPTNDIALAPGRMPVSPADLSIATGKNLLPPDTKSLLKIPTQLRHGEYVWNEEGVAAGSIAIWVDLRRQMLSVFRNGHEIGTAVIVYGAQDMSSPEGVFKILSKSSDYHSRAYDAPMPFSLFITNDGVALHGSPISERRASHGCIGLPVEFAQKLFAAAKKGDLVTISRSDAGVNF
jgi:L,D-transpeptidase catalytic domain